MREVTVHRANVSLSVNPPRVKFWCIAEEPYYNYRQTSNINRTL